MTTTDRITTTRNYDSDTGYGTGDLTAKQYASLSTCARLSPGYRFEVVRYSESPGRSGSTATHVKVWADGNDRDYVALVGRDCADYYDSNKVTEQVVKRVAQRVYRKSVYFST